jgi:hypothetical protein
LSDLRKFFKKIYIFFKLAKTLDRFWIGLNQLTVSFGFIWSDGSPVNFVNWDKGEPNDSNGGENCAEMFSSNSKILTYIIIIFITNLVFYFKKATGTVKLNFIQIKFFFC